MVKNCFRIIGVLVSVLAIYFSIAHWAQNGFSLERILPGHREFGVHELHIAMLGIIAIIYFYIDYSHSNKN